MRYIYTHIDILSIVSNVLSIVLKLDILIIIPGILFIIL